MFRVEERIDSHGERIFIITESTIYNSKALDKDEMLRKRFIRRITHALKKNKIEDDNKDSVWEILTILKI